MPIDLSSGRWIPVACECGWDNDGQLVAVDRYASDNPPIPYTGQMVEVYRDYGGDPDDRLFECPECEAPIDDLAVMRERD